MDDGTLKHLFGSKIRLLKAAEFADDRGSLVPLAFPLAGLSPVRSFLVSAPDGATRGGHGHYKARQLLMRAGGRIDVELRWHDEVKVVGLSSSDQLLLIEPGVWSRQTYRGDHAALMVFSDRPYEPEDYFEDLDWSSIPVV